MNRINSNHPKGSDPQIQNVFDILSVNCKNSRKVQNSVDLVDYRLQLTGVPTKTACSFLWLCVNRKNGNRFITFDAGSVNMLLSTVSAYQDPEVKCCRTMQLPHPIISHTKYQWNPGLGDENKLKA